MPKLSFFSDTEGFLEQREQKQAVAARREEVAKERRERNAARSTNKEQVNCIAVNDSRRCLALDRSLALNDSERLASFVVGCGERGSLCGCCV